MLPELHQEGLWAGLAGQWAEYGRVRAVGGRRVREEGAIYRTEVYRVAYRPPWPALGSVVGGTGMYTRRHVHAGRYIRSW